MKFQIALTAASIGAGLLLASPPAVATPAQDIMHDASLFCTWVHNNPTPEGMYGAVAQFVTQGVPDENTAAIISFALVNVCPEFGSLFARTNAIVNGGTTVS